MSEMLFDSSKSKCVPKQKIVVSAEKNCSHRAINEDASVVYQFKIDGDIVPSNDTAGLRCDYIVENETKASAYIIELKGTDLPHAYDQIRATVKRFKNELNGYTIKPRIVFHANTHAIHDSKYRVFLKEYANAIVKTNVIEEKI